MSATTPTLSPRRYRLTLSVLVALLAITLAFAAFFAMNGAGASTPRVGPAVSVDEPSAGQQQVDTERPCWQPQVPC